MVIADNPELAEELEAKIMEALREEDTTPKVKGKAAKTTKDAAPAAAEAENKQEDLFDDSVADDFSIEEDL